MLRSTRLHLLLVSVVLFLVVGAGPRVSAQIQNPQGRTPSQIETPEPTPSGIMLRRCRIEYEKTAVLSAPEIGTIEEIAVRLGDRVKAGQIVGRLQDDDLEAALAKAKIAAADDSGIRLAEVNLELAETQLSQTKDLFRRQAAARDTLIRHDREVQVGKLNVLIEQSKFRMAQEELRITEARLKRRHFISPHDGIVVEIARKAGESVDIREPVFTIIDTSKIEITGVLDIKHLGRVRAGQEVRVQADIGGVNLPVEELQFSGNITFVGKVVNTRIQGIKVVALVDNPNGDLQAGMLATMEIMPLALSAVDRTND